MLMTGSVAGMAGNGALPPPATALPRVLHRRNGVAVRAGPDGCCMSRGPIATAATRAGWGSQRPCQFLEVSRRSLSAKSMADGGSVGFSMQVPVEAGMLEIRPVQEEDKGAAGVVLTRAFAGSDDGQSIGNVSEYIDTLMDQSPEAVLLIARLSPTDETLLPPGQDTRLIGTVSLSMTPKTREEFQTLQPAADKCYLSNMAVDAKFRRQGVACRLLEACDKYVKEDAAMSGIQLHVRLGDQPAEQLYEKGGYSVLEKDGFMVKLRGITPRALMEKRL